MLGLWRKIMQEVWIGGQEWIFIWVIKEGLTEEVRLEENLKGLISRPCGNPGRGSG